MEPAPILTAAQEMALVILGVPAAVQGSKRILFQRKKRDQVGQKPLFPLSNLFIQIRGEGVRVM